MCATVLSLSAVRLVWYRLSRFSVSPNIFQIGGQDWLVSTLCISNWVSCKGSPCVRIGNKLGEYPSCTGSVVCSYLRCGTILPLELYSSSSFSSTTVWEFWLLNYFFPLFPLLRPLFPIGHPLLPQIIPHIVLPSYSWPSLQTRCIRPPPIYGLSHSFISHSFYMPQPAQSFVFYVFRALFTVCKYTVAVLCIMSGWISPVNCELPIWSNKQLLCWCIFVNLFYTSSEHFMMPSQKLKWYLIHTVHNITLKNRKLKYI